MPDAPSIYPDKTLHDAADRAFQARPSVGLALGGGGARGWAHIGVLQVLAEHGIVPDVIAGTSIGAIVGGSFSAGKLDALEGFARSLKPRSIFSLVDLTPLSSGLVGGEKLQKRLEDHLGSVSIEDLAIRSIFIAAELGTGHEIWLRRGNLVEAMRASYALPGIFQPVSVHGRALVDGALVNPVPVSVCRAYGARLVIAVNLSPETLSHGGTVPDLPDFEPGNDADGPWLEELSEPSGKWRTMMSRVNPLRRIVRQQLSHQGFARGIPGVMMQSFTIIQDRMTRMRLAGDPPDVAVEPRVGTVGMFDFHKADLAIQQGRIAAERAIEDIHRLSDALASK